MTPKESSNCTSGTGAVIAVSRNAAHTFSKQNQEAIRLIAGMGVEGDAHLGSTVQHLSRIAKDPTQPNLRQVHLIHAELFDELQSRGFDVQPGNLGENIATRGIDLLALPTGSRLMLGRDAIIEITGLRNPCYQLDRFQKGLVAAVLDRDADGLLIRKAGVMGIVIAGGEVRAGDAIVVRLPPPPHRALECT
jgi:MOSC domain-containing protein YiiM